MDQAFLGRIIGEFKPALRTTEFWLVFASLAYTAISTAYDPSRPFSEQAVNLALIGGSAIYAGARSFLKGKRITAVASATYALPSSPTGAEGGSTVISADEVPADPTDTDKPPTTTP